MYFQSPHHLIFFRINTSTFQSLSLRGNRGKCENMKTNKKKTVNMRHISEVSQISFQIVLNRKYWILNMVMLNIEYFRAYSEGGRRGPARREKSHTAPPTQVHTPLSSSSSSLSYSSSSPSSDRHIFSISSPRGQEVRRRGVAEAIDLSTPWLYLELSRNLRLCHHYLSYNWHYPLNWHHGSIS